MEVRPLNTPILKTVLLIGQFKPRDGLENVWIRDVDEEATRVTVTLVGDHVELTITPSISSQIHHLQKRLAAGIYFEIATRYAEKVGGTIQQRATVEGCTVGTSGTPLLLASYPQMPMSFDRVCAGFQAAILGEEGGTYGASHQDTE